MFKRRCQRGFATLEVILMIMVIGILASIAVPRFTAVTTSANTAKIQADLATIDTAIAIYKMEKGEDPKTFPDDLKDYLQDASKIKPPTGKAYIGGKAMEISGDYGIQAATATDDARATLTVGGTARTAGDFVKTK